MYYILKREKPHNLVLMRQVKYETGWSPWQFRDIFPHHTHNLLARYLLILHFPHINATAYCSLKIPIFRKVHPLLMSVYAQLAAKCRNLITYFLIDAKSFALLWEDINRAHSNYWTVNSYSEYIFVDFGVTREIFPRIILSSQSRIPKNKRSGIVFTRIQSYVGQPDRCLQWKDGIN